MRRRAHARTTACGASTPEGAEPVDGGSAGSASNDSGGELEQITPGGVGAIVLDHLGRDAVRRLSTFEPEPGSVSVMIEMRDRTPHNFALQVYSPKQGTGELGKAGTCPPQRRLGRDARCRVLGDGRTVMTSETSYGFSDDNADGRVVSGTAVTEDGGAGMAMYESYDDTPAVTTAELEAILGDPRLAWLTEPAVNVAGEDVTVQRRGG